MALETSEFGRTLEAVSDGRQSLEGLLTILSREGQLGAAERAARWDMVQALRGSGRISAAVADQVLGTMFRTGTPNAPRGTTMRSGPHAGSHPSNWTGWVDNNPAAPPLTCGSVLRDRFVLQEVIGEGGMSVVFRALDRRREEALDRQPHVAIKVLGDEFKRHPDALRALQRESRKTQKLAHPNIASVYDFDRDGPNVYMVMELLVGEPLDAILRRRGRLGFEKAETLRMLSEMGAALSHAHGLGIVHSDFKPSNAFVTESGETKVIDFGVARATKPKNADTKTALTMFDAGKLGAVTVAYCSPEQMLGDADPDPRDDIYALGIVAYELLSGRHPFGGGSALEAQLKGLQFEPIAGLADHQNAALRAALEPRREQRTATVDELLQGLGVRHATGSRGAVDATMLRERPLVAFDESRKRSAGPAREPLEQRAADAPTAGSVWRRRVLNTMLLLAIAGGGYYGFQQWQTRTGQELDRQRRATEEAQRGKRAAEELVERERLTRQKAEDQKAEEERLAEEAARRRAAKARAKAESARLAVDSAAPAKGASGPQAELQRALAAEEAEQAGGVVAATPTGEAQLPAPEPVKRTLYRWQDETGAVRYGTEVPEEFKDSAVVMLPGE